MHLILTKKVIKNIVTKWLIDSLKIRLQLLLTKNILT